MSKINVHPDHYKTAGRDRQDDAAAARQARSIAAKASSRNRPDRMSKAPEFWRSEHSQRAASKPSAAPSVKAKATPGRTATTTRPAPARPPGPSKRSKARPSSAGR